MNTLLRSVIFHMRYRYFRLMEMLDKNRPNKVVNSDPVNNLPEVEVLPANEEKEIELLEKVYYKNPSGLMMVPWKSKILKERIASGVKFFLIYNKDDILVGATGFDQKRNMFVHSIINRTHRKRGYGKSMYLRIIDLMKEQGVDEVRAQAFKENARAINMLLSIGFEIEPDNSGSNYLTMVKTLL